MNVSLKDISKHQCYSEV